MENNQVQLSSQLSAPTKILLPLLGIPIASVIAIQTHYAWWAIILTLALYFGCIWLSVKISAVLLHGDQLLLKGLLGKESTLSLSQIVKVVRIQSRRYTYYFFKSSEQTFIVISPLWGPEKQVLSELYEKYK